MPLEEKKERNKDVIQLFKVGWKKRTIAKAMKVDRANLNKVVKRDFNKYSSPTVDELRSIEKKYGIKIGEINLQSQININTQKNEDKN